MTYLIQVPWNNVVVDATKHQLRLRQEVLDWLATEIGKQQDYHWIQWLEDGYWDYDSYRGDGQTDFHFRDEQDALKFKLRWG